MDGRGTGHKGIVDSMKLHQCRVEKKFKFPRYTECISCKQWWFSRQCTI